MDFCKFRRHGWQVLVCGLALVIAPVAIADEVATSTFRTQNFVVSAPSHELAKASAEAAEQYRKQIAMEWLAKELPDWSQRCHVQVNIAERPSGLTTFVFRRGNVQGWQITVTGPEQLVLESVLPHEVTHAVLATHFRRSLPRWADEGAATLCEDEAETRRQAKRAGELLANKQLIPLRSLLAMEDYPQQSPRLYSLYVLGFSLTDFLVQLGGRETFVEFLHDANEIGWDKAVRENYHLAGVNELEQQWLNWIRAGSDPIETASTEHGEQTVELLKPTLPPDLDAWY